jgi:6-phosphogluconolactonase/glucosamine-6-phosphate isomerase/deaminase
MADVTPSGPPLPGTVQIVDNVPLAFARLVTQEAPRSIALSGGETAEQCYTAVRMAGPDWSNVDVFFGDERFVDPGDPESNENLARRSLLDEVRPRAIHSMYQPVPIAFVHLGLGPDGHTASLFPGSPTLDETERLVVTAGDDAHPLPRLTFTFPAIARARLVVITVVGAEKRDAVERIRAGEDLPGSRIRGERVVWLGDGPALGAQ